MTSIFERHIRLDGAHNVRDLGGYSTRSGAKTRWRSVLRADALHELSAKDVDGLLNLGVRTVIDLRNNVEIARQPSVLAAQPAIAYHHISLFDGLAPADVMLREQQATDLSTRYITAIDTCRPTFARIASTIADADDGIILFNCTAGKDRTGIISAMLLSLAGVEDNAIAADYALTRTLAEPLIERLRAAALARGVGGDICQVLLSSEPSSMMTLMGHVRTHYDGFQNYLSCEGTPARVLSLIGRRMVEA